MIPTFPQFKKLDLEDRDFIDDYTASYPPYSDYNFVSLWVYNTKEKVELSLLNNNLVVKFQDYISNEFFYSFLGVNSVLNTIKTLIEFARTERDIITQLKLVPEINLLGNDIFEAQKLFSIVADEDNFDYIYSLNEWSELRGIKYRGKKNFVNRFKRLYPDVYMCQLDLKNKETQKNIEDLFIVWEGLKGRDRIETETELEALRRTFSLSKFVDFISLGVLVGGKLIAFSINEVIPNGYCVGDFRKADMTHYIGAYQFLENETAKILLKHKCEYLNLEQDLGIPGLKRSKQSWFPVSYLKKYIISSLSS